MIFNAAKVRLYPTKEQELLLSKNFGCARWLWNNNLAATQAHYKETGKGLSNFAMNNRIPGLKIEFPWLDEVYSQALQSSCSNLSKAFVNFFEKRSKFPQFKRKSGKQSFQFPQGAKLESNRIYVPKIGWIKAVIHREIVGKIKTVTVSRNPSGKYFASILTEIAVEPKPISFSGKILGIDVGLLDLAVTSDGSKFSNPKHFKKKRKNLKRKQQKLARKKKGSKRREKAKLHVAKAYEKIANARSDFLHKLSRKLVDENQVIAIEDLNVKGMMRNHCLAGAIGDVGWGEFSRQLEYKATRDGKGFVKVDRFYPSSKACSDCGIIRADKMTLDIRSWECKNCGSKHDRDVNAAKNIRFEAERLITAGMVVTANGGTVSRKPGRKSSVSAGA